MRQPSESTRTTTSAQPESAAKKTDIRKAHIQRADLLNAGVIGYIFLTYGLGLGLITWPSVLHSDFRPSTLFMNGLFMNGLGIIVLVHSLILSATLLHELIHDNIFKAKSRNAFWGQAMTWLNGACYVPYEQLVRHHFNHHVHHADFVPFDIQGRIATLPLLVKQGLIALEWAYFPAIGFWLRWRNFIEPFNNHRLAHRQTRTLVVLALRLLFFAGLTYVSAKAVLLYAFAYLCFVNLMRFADAFHHTYSYVIDGDVIPERDRIYEQANTFSNLVAIKHPWLNLLYLNFGYHNAHHHNMRCPWYQLPQLHRELYGEKQQNVLPLNTLIGNYHRFRLQRLFDGQGEQSDEPTKMLAVEEFTGGIGVSFLTPP